MEVWIFSSGEEYEGSNIESVYKTKANAIAAAEKYITDYLPEKCVATVLQNRSVILLRGNTDVIIIPGSGLKNNLRFLIVNLDTIGY
jgi:hypothetical protein